LNQNDRKAQDMGNYQNPTIDYFLRHMRSVVRNNQSIKRTIIPIGKEITLKTETNKSRKIVLSASEVRNQPLNGNRNLLNAKAHLYLRVKRERLGKSVLRINPFNHINEMNEKVGLVGSGGRLGRAVQGVGSYLTPGNTSAITSPIRSGLYGALVPGGGRNPLKPRNEQARCPAGFEFGGRFADNEFSNCGAQLFEIPGPLALLARAVRAGMNVPTARVENLSEVVQGQPTGARTIQIQRMAQIPRTGSLREDALKAGMDEAITILKGAPAGEGRMIRRDGVTLRPIVPSSVLRSFSDNPDMEDGVMIRAIQRPQDISSDDLALLSGPSMSRISFVAPNGTLLTVERARPLTVGERRKFGRMLNRAVGTSDEYDVGNNIRDFANNSEGAFKYTESFPQINKPLDLVEITGSDGKKRQIRRWVYETFVKKNREKPVVGNPETVRADTTDGAVQSSSLLDAVKLLDKGSDPFDIEADYLLAALKKSKYTSSRANGATKWTMGDKSYYAIPETRANGAIARRVYSDIASQLGLDAQTVRVVGTSGKRTAFVEDVGNITPRGTGNRPDNADALRIAFSDYLSDRTSRSADSIQRNPNGGTMLIPTGNELSALAGLSKEDIQKRFGLDVAGLTKEYGGQPYANYFANLSPQQRRLLTSLADDLIERAQKFKWAEYISKISADGRFTKEEQTWLKTLERLYNSRLNNLRKSRKKFLATLGI
jgi:hypothetical protein